MIVLKLAHQQRLTFIHRARGQANNCLFLPGLPRVCGVMHRSVERARAQMPLCRNVVLAMLQSVTQSLCVLSGDGASRILRRCCRESLSLWFSVCRCSLCARVNIEVGSVSSGSDSGLYKREEPRQFTLISCVLFFLSFCWM
ncbi:hypothetical protein KP509_11G046300 [Ceratopteris richardii]|uniref:Uncharacterized protein n=1 Tax=Ceratopteris richardii TaxID=49495 RepID=A0A8T2TP30_CERRI|nr:hypothetical protein KP509_11G046300 [Ceratopteris richardii]